MPAYDTVLETYATYAWRTTSVYQRIPAYTSVYQRIPAYTSVWVIIFDTLAYASTIRYSVIPPWAIIAY